MLARFIGVIAQLVILAACTYSVSEPRRPAQVPKQALWVGGSDGGVFVEVSETPQKDSGYRMTVYHSRTGQILYTGPAEIRPRGKGSLRVHDVESYSGWDGEKMILSDGRTLEPVTPSHP